MSSNNKTTILNLNLWDGSDKPKREDFNYDNQNLDAIVGGHVINDVIHLTPEEKDKINSLFYIGSYVGDGANSKIVELGFTPSFVVIYTNSMPLVSYADGKISLFSAMSTEQGSSIGITIRENAFSVIESASMPVSDNYYPHLNSSGRRYIYIAFK